MRGRKPTAEEAADVMRGHAPDSRFSDKEPGDMKVVRPPTSVSPKKGTGKQKEGREASLSYGKAGGGKGSGSGKGGLPSKLAHTR